MSEEKGEQIGWFVWAYTNGRFHAYKYVVQGDGVNGIKWGHSEHPGLTRFPLYEKEWAVPIDELKKVYPLTIEIKRVAVNEKCAPSYILD